MKANAPEKLYIDLFKGEFNISRSPTSNSVEYIRTDAFIEKAAGWLSDNTLSGLCLDLGNAAIVREFVDNFKNYMKGE